MRRSSNRVHSVLLTLTLLLSARAGAAQLAKSLDIGFPFFGPTGWTHPPLLPVGYWAASIKPLVPGVDFSIATVPVALIFGALVLSSDLDLTDPLPARRRDDPYAARGWQPSRGGCLRQSAERGRVRGRSRYNVGVGLVGRTGPATAIRFDFTHRRFDVPISSATIGFVWTP